MFISRFHNKMKGLKKFFSSQRKNCVNIAENNAVINGSQNPNLSVPIKYEAHKNNLDSNISLSNSVHCDALPSRNEHSLVSARNIKSANLLGPSQVSNDFSPIQKPTICISINGSSGFQVGDTLNVTLGSGSCVSLSSSGEGLSSLANSLTRKVSKDAPENIALDDCFDVLKESEVWLINEYISRDWKVFGEAIGLSPPELEVLEETVNKDYVAEMLLKFRAKYPDTSVAFIATKLKETGNLPAYNQLVKLKS